ncbi:Mediator of RNA polymerase II transcription subunit 16 [Penicillium subrubescens]|uniref:Mediator of RNA polymerase II transcription subunit 16 n=1 Tax=Penicillium subrubescens TaxID=1316194 RepID=A0A1Q5UPF7_9EURO|nr:Mediator of RNA polymerase II transcription subunit 16 [Penicillium subrubescens]KAJ5880877.1 Mediator of RNA polymerase II transcription subunit 16 [Penicillium subrubescens]OKP14353.1 Mediator of RNA polymerase II transcription subunit 16 [Penicillium subrubescens]
MEDAINVDDLFGEAHSLDLGLPPAPAPPTKGLAQCLDEMRLLGCRQKVAWSRLGGIAYIASDGVRVFVRNLQSRSSNGKWVLSDEFPLGPVTEAHGGNQLVHLSWNDAGSELAVVDCLGRVSIYSVFMALNNITGLRQATYDSSDDSNQIVGLMWLNPGRQVHAFQQAAKLNNRWAYSPFRWRPTHPSHPAGKSSLISVTRAGQIKLMYQNMDGKWAEVPAELKNTGYSDRLLTHAAMVATQGTILLATYSVCQKMCLYRVEVSWNPNKWDPAAIRSPNKWPIPSLRLLHYKIDMPSCIFNVNPGSEEHSDHPLPFPNSVYTLTHLQVIPGQVDSPTGPTTTSPWILGVFSKPLHATPEHPDQQGPLSVIVRWQLDSAQQTFHPKFDEVASKKINAQAKPKIEMRRLEDIHLHKYIISVDLMEHVTAPALALTHDDSSVTFYETKTMTMFNGLDDANTVNCLAQAGFQYPMDTPGLAIAFSPNSCAAVALDSEGQPRLRWMEHTFGSSGGLYDESKFSAAIAALTLAFSRGSGSDANTDDILMIVLGQLSPENQSTFLGEVYRALSVNCNFTVEQEKLLTHAYIPRALSLQASLGFKGRSHPRNLSSAISWAILQLRHSSVLYAAYFQNSKNVPAEAHDSGILHALLGNTRWALDFSHYILSEIFDLADDFESVLHDSEAFTQKLKTTTSLPLLILLSSMSRAFMRFICRGLRGVRNGFEQLNPAMLEPESRFYYIDICQALETSPVRVDIYEKFLAGVDSAVKHAYQGSGFGDAERPSPEKELLVNARIPPVLISAVETLLSQTVPSIRAEINRKDIVLGDYTWLGFGNDPRTAAYRKRKDVDILMKIPLRPVAPGGDASGGSGGGGAQILRRRRCVRCCEVSGDGGRPRTGPWTKMMHRLNLLRACACGGAWVMEVPEPGVEGGQGR